MPAYKDEKTGKWYCQFYCKDWTGKNKHIVKRGFDKKKDALDYEENLKTPQNIKMFILKNLLKNISKKCSIK